MYLVKLCKWLIVSLIIINFEMWEVCYRDIKSMVKVFWYFDLEYMG